MAGFPIKESTRRSIKREKFYTAREFFLEPGVLKKCSGWSHRIPQEEYEIKNQPREDSLYHN
jgi:hypothetical protein